MTDKTTIPLVILAAGVGRRFGGNKQIAAIGKRGEYLLEFNLYEAYSAGVSDVFLIIQPGSQNIWKELITRWRSKLTILLVEQAEALLTGKYPQKRLKPWGTGHAVLALEGILQSDFLLINADDYYGVGAFRRLVELSNPGMAMAIFPLERTLSNSGSVNRGVCLGRDAILAGIEEYSNIKMEDGLIKGANQMEEVQVLDPQTPVSMNCWRLDSRVFAQARASIEDLVRTGIPEGSEIFLPALVQYGIIEEEWLIQLVEVPGPWYGLTFPKDLPAVEKALQKKQEEGFYPTPLWS